MERCSTRTLIIGAGPAGLAAAMELCRAGEDFVVIERQGNVGGLARTYSFKEGDLEFRTDNGPHRFFSKNPYLYEFIEDLIDERWIEVQRQTRQYIDGKFYDYPVNAGQALRNLGPAAAVRILADYARARVRYGLRKKPIENFYDYTVAHFGETLGKFNMINYTEKIWGIPAREIHADWAGQRIKGLDLVAVAKDALRRSMHLGSAGAPKTLVDRFYYPETGTGLIYETILARLTGIGYDVRLRTEPVAVHHDGRRVTVVEASGPEGPLRIEAENVIESVSLKDFVHLLAPAPPAEIMAANGRLRYRSQVYLFLTLDRPSVTADQWIYFPTADTPIARVSEMRNFSALMSPPGKTSLFIEFFCFEGDGIWEAPQDELLELAVGYFERVGFFRREEVRQHYVIRQRNVYPVYDIAYPEYLGAVKGFLAGLENLQYIGRPGRFRYNNQDHSLEMGILAAKGVIEGTRYDLDRVGGEQEYYEAGNLRSAAAPGRAEAGRDGNRAAT